MVGLAEEGLFRVVAGEDDRVAEAGWGVAGGRCCRGIGEEDDEDVETEERTDWREKDEGESGNTRESELARL